MSYREKMRTDQYTKTHNLCGCTVEVFTTDILWVHEYHRGRVILTIRPVYLKTCFLMTKLVFLHDILFSVTSQKLMRTGMGTLKCISILVKCCISIVRFKMLQISYGFRRPTSGKTSKMQITRESVQWRTNIPGQRHFIVYK